MRRRRYPSDTTLKEWALLEQLLPPPACQTPRGGRPEKHRRRDVVDAIRFLVDNGIKWRSIPHDYNIPWQTVYSIFARWARAGVIDHILHQLRSRLREHRGYCPHPVAIVVDSQTVRAAATVSKATRGYDPGKGTEGRKRHIAVDLGGLLVSVLVTAASVQDRDAARDLFSQLRQSQPQVTCAWADTAYAGALVGWAADALDLTLAIVTRPAGAVGFVLLPRRWVVERSFSWLMHARRTVRDYERLPAHAEAHIAWAAVTLMTRRLARLAAQP
ncbi:IS5 family transposase [Actinomadura rudentiformis]|uniref:IS5 family transposase n=1 Tax=Actinomadura rudentiformis TaxID=359158 RepID=A0A6H9YA37_9ACTN|nr:IS5 family transposase [Actinomadura rudentiformis]KAB2340547.1 IS5 family transposase [Actinomadura rudentiformis]